MFFLAASALPVAGWWFNAALTLLAALFAAVLGGKYATRNAKIAARPAEATVYLDAIHKAEQFARDVEHVSAELQATRIELAQVAIERGNLREQMRVVQEKMGEIQAQNEHLRDEIKELHTYNRRLIAQIGALTEQITKLGHQPTLP